MKHEEKESLQDRFVDALLREQGRSKDEADLLAGVEEAIDRETAVEPEAQGRDRKSVVF